MRYHEKLETIIDNIFLMPKWTILSYLKFWWPDSFAPALWQNDRFVSYLETGLLLRVIKSSIRRIQNMYSTSYETI